MSGPNILWIVTTQWRAQAFGFAGDPNARTPCLDALAAESINYWQAVTPHPFGPFARAALLTGLPSPANGVVDYFDPLPAEARTIAHDLTELGYATAFFGKWHLGARHPRDPLVGEAHARVVIPPESRGGFQLWEGFESGFLLNDPWLHGTRLEHPTQFAGYQSDVLCTRAADWLGARHPPAENSSRGKSQPAFCVVSLEAPHPPYDAPAAGVVPPDPRQIVLAGNVPLGGDEETKARKELAGYYAHLEATDRAIGRLLAVAKRADTLVVFTSVHGDMHGAHGLFRKGWPHEESVRVPLLLRVPGNEPGPEAERGTREKRGTGNDGRVSWAGLTSPDARRAGGQISDEAVSLVDLRAMTQAWAGQQRPVRTRLYSSISMPSIVALPHQCDRRWRGVRSKTRKLVVNSDGTPWLLFDLENDPLELNNLAADPAQRNEIAELSALIGSKPNPTS